MLKPIEINKKRYSYQEICGLYETEKEVRKKIRLQIIVLAYEGLKSEEIAKIVKLTGVTVRKHIKRYNRNGLKGLSDIARTGGEAIMTREEMIEIDKALKGSPRDVGIELSNWRGWVMQEWISERFGKEVSLQTCYNIFYRLGYSKTRAKKQNKKRDPEEAEKFREALEKLIETKDENTIILYEDEGIFTSEPTATSVWTKIGEQPIVQTPGGTRKRTVIFGAVNPETGDFFEQFSEVGNTETYQSFLSLIHANTTGKNVILIEDNATYHHFKGKAEWLPQYAPNITPMYLPSHCSDLNSVEHLWKDTRTNVSHNTLFDSFNDLVSNLRAYIHDLKLLPRKISKLCPFIY